MTTDSADAPRKLRVVSGFHKTTVQIDGHEIKVRVTRLNIDQHSEFMQGFVRTHDRHSDRLVTMRMPGDEQAKHRVPRDPTPEEQERAARLDDYRAAIERAIRGAADPVDAGRLDHLLREFEVVVTLPKQDEVFVIDDAEIRRRRLVEMTPQQLADHRALEHEEEVYARTFVAAAIADHLFVEPGQIEMEDPDTGAPTDVTSGAVLAELYGARKNIISALLGAIWRENTMSEALKNVLNSASGSQPSSAGSEGQVAPGMRPEAPAANVESVPSVTPATATGGSAGTSSGSMTEVSLR